MEWAQPTLLELAPPDFSIRSKPRLQELNYTGLPGWFFSVPLKSCGFSSPSIIAPTENECNSPHFLYSFKLPISWSSLPTALKHTQLFSSFYALMPHPPSTSFYLQVWSPSAFAACWETPKLRAELVPVPGDQTSLKDQKIKQTLEEQRRFCESLGFCETSRSRTFLIKSVQFSSVTQLCLTLCDPMGYSTPGLPVHHQLPELTQTLVHWVGEAIQPPHRLSSPSLPASGSFPMSQFFASGSQRIGVSASTSVLPMNIQDWFPLEWTGWISLQSKGLSRVFSKGIVQKHQFFSDQLSL